MKKTGINSEIDIFVKKLVRHIHPEMIILFGSAAVDPSRCNDIDLIVVWDSDKDYWQRRREVLEHESVVVPMDIFILTPDEFEREKDTNIFFKQEILTKMKVLYARVGK